MLVIRLQRTGRENTTTYRIVVAEKSAPVKGKFLEIVGHFLPARDPSVLEQKQERIQHWISKGAIPSDTVARLLSRHGMKGLGKFFFRYTKKRPKGEQPAEAAAPATAATPEAAPAKDAGDTKKKES